MGQSKKLPPRWRFRHNAYYYRPHPDQRHLWDGKHDFRLGKTEGEAWRTWYERLGQDAHGEVGTMNNLFDEWWKGYVVQYLKPATQESYEQHLKPLRRVFGHLRPHTIKPFHALRYRKERIQQGKKVSGNREVSVLSSALTYGVEIGVIEYNPLRGQLPRKGIAKEKKRDRVPSSDEIAAFLAVEGQPKVLRGYVALKRITGLRMSQLLSIDLGEQFRDGELLIDGSDRGGKGGKDTDYHGDALEAVIEFILYDRYGTTGLKVGPLFTTRRGFAYTRSGFNSIWRRAMDRYVKAGGAKFNEHDIRALAADEANTLEHAQFLLGHKDPKTTTIYRGRGRRKVEVLSHDPQKTPENR